MADSGAVDSVQTLLGPVLGDGPSACAQCGTAFTPRPRGRNARFCSTRCRGRWHAAQKAARLIELDAILARAFQIVRELRERHD